MEKARQQRISTAGLENGRRVRMVLSATLFAQTVAFTPTAASAFDIRGLIGTAIALQMGAYHAAPYHQARGHVGSRHDSDSNGNSSSAERDARAVVDVCPITPASQTQSLAPISLTHLRKSRP